MVVASRLSRAPPLVHLGARERGRRPAGVQRNRGTAVGGATEALPAPIPEGDEGRDQSRVRVVARSPFQLQVAPSRLIPEQPDASFGLGIAIEESPRGTHYGHGGR